MQQIWYILSKDLTVELRKSYTLYSVLLFALVLVFILYKSFNRMAGMEWNVMLWITTLFCGINAIVKSFAQEKDETRLYYYQLVKAPYYIGAKMIYNFIFLVMLFLIIFGSFSFFLGNPIKDWGIFTAGATAGLVGISAILTMVSSLAGESEGGGALLMNILSLPLTIPVLLLLIKIGAGSMRLIQDTSTDKDIWMLVGIDMVVIGLCLVLFSEIWKN